MVREYRTAYGTIPIAIAEQYNSIGDSLTGFEHFVKSSLVNDGRVLDSTAPESLVYAVSGSTRTLVADMYMAAEGTPINDETSGFSFRLFILRPCLNR